MIKSLELINLKIPFRLSFKHNSAERKVTQSIIVKANDGTNYGYGEGCPREYVTGESIATATHFFEQIKNNVIKEVSDIESLKLFLNEKSTLIRNNHAAWCAIELALIDLIAKRNYCSAEKLLNLPELTGEYKYTAVIGDGSVEYFTEVAKRHLQMGFNDFKIKISGAKETDHEKLSILKKINNNCTIRLDANNTWENIAAVVDYMKGIHCEIIGLEEPLKNKNLDELISLAEKINTPIILDESFNHVDDLKKIARHKKHFIINLRVSKMGGLLNSLQIAEFCAKEKIPVIIGAQVGETSILTRAGLLMASVLKSDCIGLEGGYGTLLLEHDIAEPSLTFGKAGIIDPEKLLDATINGFQLNITDFNL